MSLIPKKGTVYIVDDDEAVRSSLRLLMKSVGLAVETHASAAEFLSAYNPALPGCLVLDVRMPEISGLEVFKRLRVAGMEVPVIFLTGHGEVSMAVDAMRDGAFHFLEKPVNDQKLIDAVFAALAKDTKRRESAGSNARVNELVSKLTPREREIAELIADGASSRDVAEKLELSVRTVEGYRSRILDKLKADSLAQMIKTIHAARGAIH